LKRLLFYRRGGLGDTLLTFPILQIFKRRGFFITTVGNTDYFKIAQKVGWADQILPEPPRSSFDLQIKIGVNGIPPFPKERIWIVDYYLKSLNLFEPFSKRLPLEGYLDSPLRDKVVLHPSSGSPKKNPPVELFLRIKEFFERLGLECLYLVGEADGWLKKYVKNFVEMLDPLEIAKHLAVAKLFVGNDSGVSHLSAYLGVPTYIFYGPTDWKVWRPIGERVFPISLNLPCSPCFPNTCQEMHCFEVDRLFELFVHWVGISL